MLLQPRGNIPRYSIQVQDVPTRISFLSPETLPLLRQHWQHPTPTQATQSVLNLGRKVKKRSHGQVVRVKLSDDHHAQKYAFNDAGCIFKGVVYFVGTITL